MTYSPSSATSKPSWTDGTNYLDALSRLPLKYSLVFLVQTRSFIDDANPRRAAETFGATPQTEAKFCCWRTETQLRFYHLHHKMCTLTAFT